MQTINVKREVLDGLRWIAGLVLLLAAVSAMQGQTVKRVNLGVQTGKAGFVPVATAVRLPDVVREPGMGVQEQLVRLPNWNGIHTMFHPSPVVVMMDEPVDISYIRRVHSGYKQVGPKLWKKIGR